MNVASPHMMQQRSLLVFGKLSYHTEIGNLIQIAIEWL